MGVAGREIRVGGMLVQTARRLVERHLRQCPALDGAEKVLAVLEMRRAIRRTGRKACVEIERMMVRLKVRAALLAIVDNLALFFRRAAPVGKGSVPTSRGPRPAHALGRQRVADRLEVLRRNRLAP